MSRKLQQLDRRASFFEKSLLKNINYSSSLSTDENIFNIITCKSYTLLPMYDQGFQFIVEEICRCVSNPAVDCSFHFFDICEMFFAERFLLSTEDGKVARSECQVSRVGAESQRNPCVRRWSKFF